MAHTNSINKVMSYLEDKQDPVTISDIVFNVHLTSKSVLAVLEILKQFQKIKVFTNGKISLVVLNEVTNK
jgi:hypothetical protein